MRGTPGLHPRDVHGAAEVVAVGRPGQPGGLAGGLARAPAISSAAVPLALTLAMVGDEKLPARHALALSRLGHRRSLTNPLSATTTPTERSSARSLKKTVRDGDPKKTDQEEHARSDRLKEDKFKPAPTHAYRGTTKRWPPATGRDAWLALFVTALGKRLGLIREDVGKDLVAPVIEGLRSKRAAPRGKANSPAAILARWAGPARRHRL